MHTHTQTHVHTHTHARTRTPYICTYTESQEEPLYIMWMWARHNHKLEDRNDHLRIKETRFHVVARQTKPCCEVVKVHGANTWYAKLVGERCVDVHHYGRTADAHFAMGCASRREKAAFSGAFKPQRTSGPWIPAKMF